MREPPDPSLPITSVKKIGLPVSDVVVFDVASPAAAVVSADEALFELESCEPPFWSRPFPFPSEASTVVVVAALVAEALVELKFFEPPFWSRPFPFPPETSVVAVAALVFEALAELGSFKLEPFPFSTFPFPPEDPIAVVEPFEIADEAVADGSAEFEELAPFPETVN